MAKQQGEVILTEQGNTFHLRIYYRRNNSWQGSICWLDKEKTVFFRSLLEMTLLMLEAVRSEAGNPGGDL